LGTNNFEEILEESYQIICSSQGSQCYKRAFSTLNREKLEPNATTKLHRFFLYFRDILHLSLMQLFNDEND